MTKETNNKYIKVAKRGREILLLQTYLSDVPNIELIELNEVLSENTLLKRAIQNEIKMRSLNMTLEQIFNAIFTDPLPEE